MKYPAPRLRRRRGAGGVDEVLARIARCGAIARMVEADVDVALREAGFRPRMEAGQRALDQLEIDEISEVADQAAVEIADAGLAVAAHHPSEFGPFGLAVLDDGSRPEDRVRVIVEDCQVYVPRIVEALTLRALTLP